MTKFEEEAIKEAEKSKVITKYYDGESTASDIGLNIKLGRATLNFPWLEFAKNWHSDEEFKAEIKKLTDQLITRNDELISSNYEIESLKSQLISREKQVIELKEADKAQVKEIIQLKYQLQQQALPVVPSFVAEWIEILKTKGLKPLKNPETYGETGFTEETLQNIVFWISEHQEDYMRAWLDGYTVEKPQLFYLKNKLTTSYLILDTSTGYFEHWGSTEATGRYKSEFTQQEIDSMHAESYEQIEVKE